MDLINSFVRASESFLSPSYCVEPSTAVNELLDSSYFILFKLYIFLIGRYFP